VLEQVDLGRALSKAQYREAIEPLEWRLGQLQRDARSAGVPVIILFEGWDAAGKGTLINHLVSALDPRGFKVHPISAPNEEESLRPFLWRFWTKTPARGSIAIFDRSWYGRVLVGRVDKLVADDVWQRAYDEILQLERQLAHDGAVIIKFWLHIDKKEQKRRFEKLEKDPALAWKVTKEEWRHHKQYTKYAEAVEEMLARTSTAHAPWTIVEANDSRYARVKAAMTIVEAIERGIETAARTAAPVSVEQGDPDPAQTTAPAAAVEPASPAAVDVPTILDRVDLSRSLERDEYSRQLKRLQRRLFRLEHEIYLARIPVVIVYEGWDAGGKGGNIKRLTAGLDPRGYEVIPVGVPTTEEKAHHYMWRFWRDIPKAGHITIFDRSWYGRVMVERVEGFCTRDQWERAYREINEFEAQLAAFGTVIVKFWLQISQEEQLRRFEERQRTTRKRWKITEEDWRNREKWQAYEPAVIEMLQRTSTPAAPWTIVEANCKWYARVKALRTVAKAVKAALDRAKTARS